MRLPRLPQVRLVPLTRALVDRLRAEASHALDGDRSCSLHAMTTSCFASETCARGARPMDLEDMLLQPHAYAAVDQTGAFVGCVSAAPLASETLRRLFPHYSPPFGSLLLSNLCVAEAYRKEGVGRRLVDAVRAQAGSVVHLLVARHGERSASPDVAAAFAVRVPRLRATYAHMGFDAVDECDDAVLMRSR